MCLAFFFLVPPIPVIQNFKRAKISILLYKTNLLSLCYCISLHLSWDNKELSLLLAIVYYESSLFVFFYLEALVGPLPCFVCVFFSLCLVKIFSIALRQDHSAYGCARYSAVCNAKLIKLKCLIGSFRLGRRWGTWSFWEVTWDSWPSPYVLIIRWWSK